jgi:hypothetical protein
MSALRLSREERRVTCVHEAGHAVLHALGGAFVYRVAVAPEGATDWTTTARKGQMMTDLWGVCESSGTLAEMFIRWVPDDLCMAADRVMFENTLRRLDERTPGSGREARRQVRAHAVAALAGPAAEAIFKGEAPALCEGNWGPNDDVTRAEALCWLLPWRTERDHLEALTVRTLRDPAVWALVLRLADALERTGDLEELREYLPAPVPNWPPSVRVQRWPECGSGSLAIGAVGSTQ